MTRPERYRPRVAPTPAPRNGVSWTYAWVLPDGRLMSDSQAAAVQAEITRKRTRRERRSVQP